MKKFLYSLIISFLILFPQVSIAKTVPCGVDDVSLGGKETQVIGESIVFEGPGEEYKKVINKKASDITRTIRFHQIDESTIVKSMCYKDNWTYIKIIEPSWLSHVEGWVDSSILLSIQKDDNGNRIYRAENFHWDNISKKYKKDIVDAMNFLYESNLCKPMDPYSLSFSKSKSTKEKDVFYISCGEGIKSKNVFFDQNQIVEWAQEYRKGKK